MSSVSSTLAFVAADMRSRGLAEPTIKAYTRIIRPFVETEPKLEKLDRLTCSEWIHAADSVSKQRHRYLAMNALCRALVDDGTLSENPCARIKQPLEPVATQPALTDGEFQALLDSCDLRTTVGKRDRAIIATLDSTGCRVAEIAGVEVADVDLEAAHIVIRKPKKDRYGLARMRTVYLSPQAVKAVASWLRVRDRIAHGDALWVGADGRPLSSNGIQQMVARRGSRLGFVSSPHRFRRRFATQWLLNGLGEGSLMRVGGWRSSAMPARYAAASMDEIARADHARLFNHRS